MIHARHFGPAVGVGAAVGGMLGLGDARCGPRAIWSSPARRATRRCLGRLARPIRTSALRRGSGHALQRAAPRRSDSVCRPRPRTIWPSSRRGLRAVAGDDQPPAAVAAAVGRVVERRAESRRAAIGPASRRGHRPRGTIAISVASSIRAQAPRHPAIVSKCIRIAASGYAATMNRGKPPIARRQPTSPKIERFAVAHQRHAAQQRVLGLGQARDRRRPARGRRGGLLRAWPRRAAGRRCAAAAGRAAWCRTDRPARAGRSRFRPGESRRSTRRTPPAARRPRRSCALANTQQ